MSNPSKQQSHLHKPFIRFIWIATKLMKIKRNPWIIYNQEGGLKPLNRRLAEINVHGSVFLEGKRGGRLEQKLPGNELLLAHPNRFSFHIGPLHHSISSSGCCFQEGLEGEKGNVGTPVRNNVGKSNWKLGFNWFFARGEPEVNNFKISTFSISVSRDACTNHFLFIVHYMPGKISYRRVSLDPLKTGQFWQKLRKMCAWIQSVPFLSYFSS